MLLFALKPIPSLTGSPGMTAAGARLVKAAPLSVEEHQHMLDANGKVAAG
jgi:hypothetical protein